MQQQLLPENKQRLLLCGLRGGRKTCGQKDADLETILHYNGSDAVGKPEVAALGQGTRGGLSVLPSSGCARLKV
jgi:hypothetical protein